MHPPAVRRESETELRPSHPPSHPANNSPGQRLAPQLEDPLVPPVPFVSIRRDQEALLSSAVPTRQCYFFCSQVTEAESTHRRDGHQYSRQMKGHSMFRVSCSTQRNI